MGNTNNHQRSSEVRAAFGVAGLDQSFFDLTSARDLMAVSSSILPDARRNANRLQNLCVCWAHLLQNNAPDELHDIGSIAINVYDRRIKATDTTLQRIKRPGYLVWFSQGPPGIFTTTSNTQIDTLALLGPRAQHMTIGINVTVSLNIRIPEYIHRNVAPRHLVLSGNLSFPIEQHENTIQLWYNSLSPATWHVYFWKPLLQACSGKLFVQDVCFDGLHQKNGNPLPKEFPDRCTQGLLRAIDDLSTSEAAAAPLVWIVYSFPFNLHSFLSALGTLKWFRNTRVHLKVLRNEHALQCFATELTPGHLASIPPTHHHIWTVQMWWHPQLTMKALTFFTFLDTLVLIGPPHNMINVEPPLDRSHQVIIHIEVQLGSSPGMCIGAIHRALHLCNATSGRVKMEVELPPNYWKSVDRQPRKEELAILLQENRVSKSVHTTSPLLAIEGTEWKSHEWWSSPAVTNVQNMVTINVASNRRCMLPPPTV